MKAESSNDRLGINIYMQILVKNVISSLFASIFYKFLIFNVHYR